MPLLVISPLESVASCNKRFRLQSIIGAVCHGSLHSPEQIQELVLCRWKEMVQIPSATRFQISFPCISSTLIIPRYFCSDHTYAYPLIFMASSLTCSVFGEIFNYDTLNIHYFWQRQRSKSHQQELSPLHRKERRSVAVLTMPSI